MFKRILKFFSLWEVKETEKLPTTSQLSKMTKRSIEVYAREHHGIELDRRMTKQNMIKDLYERYFDQ